MMMRLGVDSLVHGGALAPESHAISLRVNLLSFYAVYPASVLVRARSKSLITRATHKKHQIANMQTSLLQSTASVLLRARARALACTGAAGAQAHAGYVWQRPAGTDARAAMRGGYSSRGQLPERAATSTTPEPSKE